ncbi:histone-lysine N-methyltransferase SETMAR [Plakobranchus ocellatus]|uniref:Histone-lysine N-methyltransferase SETMAR n=1 Tax=Plakobranchus ocellatus TaxID=259542 RepID=A0AAV4ASA4_9GAST|nr:histone-lysine N-methyltransferase SETMAR [Plakobranchus ocellatus]
MATVLWDAKGVILLDILPQGQCINAARYCSTLDRLKEAIRRKRPGLLRRGVVLHSAVPATTAIGKASLSAPIGLVYYGIFEVPSSRGQAFLSLQFVEIKDPRGITIATDGSILVADGSSRTLHLVSSQDVWTKLLWSVPGDRDQDDKLFGVSMDGREVPIKKIVVVSSTVTCNSTTSSEVEDIINVCDINADIACFRISAMVSYFLRLLLGIREDIIETNEADLGKVMVVSDFIDSVVSNGVVIPDTLLRNLLTGRTH